MCLSGTNIASSFNELKYRTLGFQFASTFRTPVSNIEAWWTYTLLFQFSGTFSIYAYRLFVSQCGCRWFRNVFLPELVATLDRAMPRSHRVCAAIEAIYFRCVNSRKQLDNCCRPWLQMYLSGCLVWNDLFSAAGGSRWHYGPRSNRNGTSCLAYIHNVRYVNVLTLRIHVYIYSVLLRSVQLYYTLTH